MLLKVSLAAWRRNLWECLSPSQQLYCRTSARTHRISASLHQVYFQRENFKSIYFYSTTSSFSRTTKANKQTKPPRRCLYASFSLSAAIFPGRFSITAHYCLQPTVVVTLCCSCCTIPHISTSPMTRTDCSSQCIFLDGSSIWNITPDRVHRTSEKVDFLTTESQQIKAHKSNEISTMYLPRPQRTTQAGFVPGVTFFCSLKYGRIFSQQQLYTSVASATY